MKHIKSILICGLTLALTGLTTLLVAAGAERNTKAIVRSMHGTVQYKVGDEQFKPLRVNMELAPGTILKSEADSDAYLQVNGFASTVKLMASTTVTLEKMLAMGAAFSADTTTDLKLDGGQLLGSVRKLSANSDYKVTVPNGVAGIRGTDFSVTVTAGVSGGFVVTFTSVTGQIQCQATVTAGGNIGQVVMKNLNTGESWTPGADCQGQVVAVAQAVLDTLNRDFLSLAAVAALGQPVIVTVTQPITKNPSPE